MRPCVEEVAALTKAAKDAALRRSGFEKELTDAQETIKEKEANVAERGDELEVRPGGYCAPRHRMPFNFLRNDGSKCVSMTWRAMFACP